MDWVEEGKCIPTPFKFNRSWLEEVDFVAFVKRECPRLQVEVAFGAMGCLMAKLKLLKYLVCDWECRIKVECNTKLEVIKSSIVNILLISWLRSLSLEESTHLGVLKSRKEVILGFEVSTMRLKNCASWIEQGDTNTNFF